MQKNFATYVLPYDVREVVRDAYPEFLSYDIEQIETMDYAISDVRIRLESPWQHKRL
jgi:hypothetical protein